MSLNQKTASEKFEIARNIDRPNVNMYINELFTDFFETCGDRLSNNDKSIICGIGKYHNKPVTIIGHVKGRTLEENIHCNFGMPNPSGYRKVQRAVLQAEKFNRPIITFIDTPGAYPGIEAEKNGQGEAIAKSIAVMSSVTVPVITVVIGEGGSGGALALGVANIIIMLENSVYSVLSPEGFSSILWKDTSRKEEACELLKPTAQDLFKLGICDYIISENDINKEFKNIINELDKIIFDEINKLLKLKNKNKLAIKDYRYKKFRQIGEVLEEN